MFLRVQSLSVSYHKNKCKLSFIFSVHELANLGKYIKRGGEYLKKDIFLGPLSMMFPRQILALLCEATGYGYEKKSLIIGNYKLIHSKDGDVTFLFDLKNEPKEKSPTVDRETISIFLNK